MQVMASVVERVLLQFLQPFTFSSHHTRIQEPYNYYEFGQRYVRCVCAPGEDIPYLLLGEYSLFISNFSALAWVCGEIPLIEWLAPSMAAELCCLHITRQMHPWLGELTRPVPCKPTFLTAPGSAALDPEIPWMCCA